MRLGPLIVRELREQARRPLNHGLRVFGAAILVLLTAHVVVGGWTGPRPVMMWTGPGRPWPVNARGWEFVESVIRQFENRGAVLFGVMNMVLLGTIWLLGPLLTADCLSRERREGTLGLLFLTPLRAGDVVLAKVMAHAMRAAGVFLGAVPVLALPVLLGGVSWMDIVRAALLDASALLLALSVGLWASTRWQGPRAAAFGALGTAIATGALWVFGWTLLSTLLSPGRPTWAARLGELGPALVWRAKWLWQMVGAFVTEPGQFLWWRSNAGLRRPGDLLPAAGLLVLAIGSAAWVCGVAARSVARAQREGRPTGRVQAASEWLGRDRYFRRGWERFRRWLLDHQPAVWLELRTWRLRVGAWLMLLPLAPVLTWWVGGTWGFRPERNETPILALSMMLAMAAASCFQLEREGGGLEMLLTVPRGGRRLLVGKLLGLAGQAVPSTVLIALVAALMFPLALTPVAGGASAKGYVMLLGIRLGLTIAAGMYFSLRLPAGLPAIGATLVVVGVAGAASDGARMGWVPPGGEPTVRHWVAAGEVVLASGFLFLLHRALSVRGPWWRRRVGARGADGAVR